MSGGTTLGALSEISADIAVAVSFRLANELMSSEGGDSSTDELVAVLLGTAVILVATGAVLKMRVDAYKSRSRKPAQETGGAKGSGDSATPSLLVPEARLLDFIAVIFQILTRITMSTLVQVLAASASQDQVSSRPARILTLTSLALFFVWTGSAAALGLGLSQ